MAKQKTVEQQPDVTPDPFIESVENVIQNLENAMAELEAARISGEKSGRSLMRIIGAKQSVVELIKNLKPIIE